jgi:hypothetical protein
MTDTFINYRMGLMTISDGYATKNLVLYTPAKPSVEHKTPLWDELEPEEEDTQPILTVGKALNFKNETRMTTINNFISNPLVVTQPTSQLLNTIMG